jgi:outer membrane protein
MQLTIPVFEGGGVNSRVRQALYEYEAGQERLDGIRQTVVRDVRVAYRGVLSAISQIEALRATLKSARSALEAAETGLEVGNRTMVDVLTEQAQAFKAQREYARARYDYILSQFRLKWASGVLTTGDVMSINQGLIRNSVATR